MVLKHRNPNCPEAPHRIKHRNPNCPEAPHRIRSHTPRDPPPHSPPDLPPGRLMGGLGGHSPLYDTTRFCARRYQTRRQPREGRRQRQRRDARNRTERQRRDAKETPSHTPTGRRIFFPLEKLLDRRSPHDTSIKTLRT